jgi:hypothetical protein
MDLKLLEQIPLEISSFVNSLKKDNRFEFYPSLSGCTDIGQKINLGFSNYGLKIKFMLGEISEPNLINDWSEYLNSYQVEDKNFPKNSFVDRAFLDGYNNLDLKNELKFKVKYMSNLILNKNFDTKKIALNKAINAETKQTISTLYQIGKANKKNLEKEHKNFVDAKNYLNSLDWSQPWSAGAQFSSMCVYSETQDFGYSKNLYEYITSLVDEQTGSYYKNTPGTSRQIINGAMKVITGLDWINYEIHRPNKLIDFCLTNIPESEGCDIVDYVYVLYKCSKQTTYKKKDINDIFKNIIRQLLKLYNSKDQAFSYYENKAQTHYYGLKITHGTDKADLHGSLLCLWAIFMMMENMENLNPKYNVIKP